MKKWIVAILLALLILPVAFAQDSADQNTDDGSQIRDDVAQRNKRQGNANTAEVGERTQKVQERLANAQAKRDTLSARKVTKANARTRTTAFADAVLTKLEKMQAEGADEVVVAIKTAKQELETLSEDATAQEYRAAYKKLLQASKNARQFIADAQSQRKEKQIEHVVETLAKLEEKVQTILERLGSKGVDVSSVDLSTFKTHVETAQQQQDAGNLKETRQELRQAHKALKDAVQTLRNLKPTEADS